MRRIHDRARHLGLLAAATATLLLPGCFPGAIVDPVTGEPIWTSVAPRAATLSAIGETKQLVIINNMVKVSVAGSGMTWRTIDPSVVSVDSLGLVTAISEGTARVVAATSKHTDTATFEVRQSVESIVVTPATAAVAVGGAQQFVATLRDRNGHVVGSRSVTWTSSANEIASVSAGGVVTGLKPGAAIVSANVGGASGNAAISVTMTADVTAPSTPLNLVASAVGPTQVNLSWSTSTDNVAVTGYRVFRNGVQVGTTGTPSYQDTGLAGATTYSYAVAAHDLAGNVSPQSAAASATTSAAPDVTPPSMPLNLVASAVGPTQVNLSWSASTDNVAVTGYRVFRDGAQVGTSATAAFQDAALTAGTAYSYRVVAHDAAGNVSAQSAAASATTPSKVADLCAGAPVPAPGPAPAGAIAVRVVRLGAGCGAGVVSSAIPLAPGRLTAGQLKQVRLLVGGVEQALHVEALAARPDGSLRAVLVQFEYTTRADTPVAGYLVLGQPRGTTDLPRPATDRGNPQAVLLPTEAAYLVATDLVGPTVTTAATAATDPPGSTVAQYEANFRRYADQHWAQGGAAWTENYYDRAKIYYAWWVRTGEVEYWRRATALALAYRRDYLEANNYAASAHWLQIEGVALHYLLTGDEASRTAVGRVADVFNLPYYMDNLGDVAAEMDNRVQARTLLALLTAWKLAAPSQSGTDWGARLPVALTRILASQHASGAYRFTRPTLQCGYNKPFMVGLLNEALITYAATYTADARIPGAVQRAVDYLWATDWNPTARAFVYLDGPCPGYDEGQVPAPDLNTLIVTGFGWLYQQTGTSSYRDRAEQILAGGVAQAWLTGSKQFNEHYTSSFHYLRYRQ